MKTILGLFTLLMSSGLFAQTCYVDMVDRYQRVVATYTGYGDSTCYEGMKECRKAIRMQPQLGGVDCIRDTQNQPQPNPYPRPNPNPNPYPQPNPYPNPRPDSYQALSVKSLIQDLIIPMSDMEVRVKVMEGLIMNLNANQLMPFINICRPTRTWLENSQCLLDGVYRAPDQRADEQSAISAVARSCTLTKTWLDERNCFKHSLENGRFRQLNYYGDSCMQMSNMESGAKCYRSIFGIR